MERNCTVLLHYDKNTPPNEDEIREELEHKEVDKKVSGLKTLISLTLNGEVMPKLLMTVIRFCVPCDNHQIKKLLLIYWEVIDKTGPDGKLLPEMILVCNNLRNDLSHANEYIRGCTLRFLCKLKEPEILEPLIPTIKNNLEHPTPSSGATPCSPASPSTRASRSCCLTGPRSSRRCSRRRRTSRASATPS